jgi:hypothetical protein
LRAFFEATVKGKGWFYQQKLPVRAQANIDTT